MNSDEVRRIVLNEQVRFLNLLDELKMTKHVKVELKRRIALLDARILRDHQSLVEAEDDLIRQ